MAEYRDNTPSDLTLCIERLRCGHVVALPTETVYGLAAVATCDAAVGHIFRLKKRPFFNPLIVHVDHIDRVRAWIELSPWAQRCADLFWPGPLTLICPLKPNHGLSSAVTAGLDTVGVRIPSHPVMRHILQTLKQPLAAPSANPSGTLSCTHAQDVMDAFSSEEDLWVLEGGACAIGLESTIVDTTCTPALVLRSGGLALETLQKALGASSVSLDPRLSVPCDISPLKIRSPGQLLRHYAPRLPLRKDVKKPHPDEVFLGFGSIARGCHHNLSESGNLEEAAFRLFHLLRQVDRPDLYQGIAVAPLPCEGLGLALNDRLERACQDKMSSAIHDISYSS